MADIVLCRIDSRLIHGQVMTKWVNQSGADKIVVVSDELAADEFMLEIYLLAAPAGVTVTCYSRSDAITRWKEDQYGRGKVLLLPDVTSMRQLYEAGVKVTDIQVGGLGGGPQRKVVFQNITLDHGDATDLLWLQEQGVTIIFQTIPEDVPQKLNAMIKKFNS